MNSTAHHRHATRKVGYDYTQAGAYFVTIVTAERAGRFGTIVDGEMNLNGVGQMLLNEWQRLPGRFSGLEVDAFMIMPNHIHGLLILYPPSVVTTDDIVGAQRDGSSPQPSIVPLRPHASRVGIDDGDSAPHVNTGSVGAIVRAFKSSTTLRYHRMRAAEPGLLWQRNYYEHIVRGSASLDHIRAYILINPTQWELDHENPDRIP